MNLPTSDRVFLPLLFAILSLLVVFIYQMGVNSRLKKEQESAFKQLEQAQREREPLVEQARKIQAGLQALAEDLLTLAETDSDAAALVKQFNIQRNPAAASNPATP